MSLTMLPSNLLTVVVGVVAVRFVTGTPLINELVTRALTPGAPPSASHAVVARSPDRDGRRPSGGLLSGLTDAAEDLRSALGGGGRLRAAPPKLPKLPPLPPLVPPAILNRGLGKALSTVSILGQIDSYVAERARTLVRKLLLLVSDEDLMADYYKTQQPYDAAS